MSKSPKDSNRVAVCYIQNSDGLVLMGLRKDVKLWSNIGGHVHVGEDPFESAVRECKEECGLDIEEIRLIKVAKIPSGKLIYLFECKVDPDQKIDFSKDPDGEFQDCVYKNLWDIKDDLYVPLEYNLVAEHWCKQNPTCQDS